jgi:uncharacterized Zn finger protein
MSETVSAKAHRIYAEGRVTSLGTTPDGARRFEVVGDSGTYLVRWHPTAWTCTCRARGRCSHELAAVLCWSAAHRAGNVVDPSEEEQYG